MLRLSRAAKILPPPTSQKHPSAGTGVPDPRLHPMLAPLLLRCEPRFQGFPRHFSHLPLLWGLFPPLALGERRPPPCPATLLPSPKERRSLPPRPQWPTTHRLCRPRPPASLHWALCPLSALPCPALCSALPCSALSFLHWHRPCSPQRAPHRNAPQSKASPWSMVLHQTAAHQLRLGLVFLFLSLVVAPSSPSSFSFPNLPLLSSMVGLFTTLGSLFSTISHELFEFMICFTSHPCPRHSNLFAPQRRTSSRLAASSVEISNPPS